jgi:DNA topoisomerase-1
LIYSASLEGPITRKHAKNGFQYHNAGGNSVRDPAELTRIASLAVPPAYTKSSFPQHLKAIGIDARGGRQYPYHANWDGARKSQI